MARPAPDMMGPEPKSKLRITIPDVVRQRVLHMRSARPDEIVNDAHAIRKLLTFGLDLIEGGAAPTAAAIRANLPNGGHAKDIKLLKSEVARLKMYLRSNIENVDGVAGAARHVLWVALNAAERSKRKTTPLPETAGGERT